MAILNFNAATVTPDTGTPELIPAGWYNVVADESELKPTREGTGSYLQMRFSVVDGQYQGRKIFTNFNIQNTNSQTVEIAYKQLSALAHAVGVLNVQDSSQLHNIPLRIKVKVKAGDGTYDARNEVGAYRNVNDPTAYPTGAASNPTPPTPTIPVFAQPAPPQQQYAPPAQQQYQQPPVQQQPAPQQYAPPPAQQYAPPAGQPPQQQYAPPPVQQQPPLQAQQPQFQQQQQQWQPPQGAQGQQPWETAQQQPPAFNPAGQPPPFAGAPVQQPPQQQAAGAPPQYTPPAGGVTPPWVQQQQ